MIDDTSLALGLAREQHLLDDRRKRIRGALDGARERIAAERPEAYHSQLGLLAGLERHSRVVYHDEHVAAANDRALPGVVQRHDRNVFTVDVLPDIQLGPIGERKDTEALAVSCAGVVEAPQLRPLLLGIPSVLRRSDREDPFLGA